MSLLTKMKYSFISQGIDKETFTVISFKGFEAISKPYEFEIILVSDISNIDPLKLLQNPAIFTIHRDGEENVDFNGILMQFEETQEYDGYFFFRAVLSPKFWWLSLTHHNQVFLDSTVQKIMENALKDGGLVDGIDFEFRLQNTYAKLEYVCQYDESHFDFVARWAEREGIYYFFEQTLNGEKIVFTDTKISHKDLLLGKDLTYVPASGLDALHTKEVIKTFLCKHNLLPQRVYLKDYNYLKPSLAIEGIADVDENGRGENYIYGVHFDTPEEGNRLAKVRAEALICRKSVFTGESSVPFIVPGYTFDLNDHYKDIYNRKYLVTEVTHEGHQTGYLISGLSAVVEKRDEQMFYSNTFTAIYSDDQFRAEHATQKPKISGTINAKIDAAASGEHAELDEYGRYKVILPFDRSGRFNGKASAWFRMMSPSAGRNRGMHFPLHKGTEVLLTFIDGNPDRPVIAGAIPNPETASPVSSGNQTKSIITTGKSPVDHSVGAAEYVGSTTTSGTSNTSYTNQSDNYIEFEDASGSERIRIHSDQDIWLEAQERFAEYTIGVPTTAEARPTSITGLIDTMYNFSSTGFAPTGVKIYKDESPYSESITFTSGASTTSWASTAGTATTDEGKWQYLVDRGKVKIAKGDTFNVQEGNIYDFGGYWNYDLGNCYVEEHLDQSAELNKTRSRDLLDSGGPGWTKVDWSKAQDSNASAGPSENDIKIGKKINWREEPTSGGGCTNVWVNKAFGNSYTYTEADSIEVTKGSSLEIQHGGRHVEMGFRGSGSIKSWTKSESGKSWGKTWNSSGILMSSSNTFKDGDVKHTHSYNWRPTAGLFMDFATNASLSCKIGASTENSVYLGAKQTFSLNVAASLSIDIAVGAPNIKLSASAAAKVDISADASLFFKMSAGAGIGMTIEAKPAIITYNLQNGHFRWEGPGTDVQKKADLEADMNNLVLAATKANLEKQNIHFSSGNVKLVKSELMVKFGISISA
ncbi:MAG: type VI secretion system tip protein VgrG [Desulfobacula sp.]|nr:type VI secretion system tip protein VgrG [Desulfobacula sp.]